MQALQDCERRADESNHTSSTGPALPDGLDRLALELFQRLDPGIVPFKGYTEPQWEALLADFRSVSAP